MVANRGFCGFWGNYEKPSYITKPHSKPIKKENYK